MSNNSEQTQSQTDVSSSEQLLGFVPIQSEANDIGVPVQLVGPEGEEDIFFGSQSIELNGERHVIVSQAQDPETGEILLVLQGENGEHIAIQPEALNSMVQASGEGGIQVAVVSQSDETGLTITTDVNSLNNTQSISASELTSIATTSIDILPSIIANIPSQTQTTTAPTNVVQAIDTPRVTAQEEQSISLSSMTSTNTGRESEKSVETSTLTTHVIETSIKKQNETIVEDINGEKVTLNSVENQSETKSEEITKSSDEENVSQQKIDAKEDPKLETNDVSKPNETAVSQEPEKVVPSNALTEETKSESNIKQSEIVENTSTASIQSTSEIGFGNTAVIQVQDSGNGTSLETLMANAMLSSDGNYVFMAQTEDGQMTSLPSELNLSEVINAGSATGQAFFIETPEGLVACTASAANEDGAIQLIPTGSGDIDNSAQSSGNSVENQIMQAISGGQAMAYTLSSNSNSGCIELTPVSTPQTQTIPSKPTRGRCGRPPKSRTITPISSSMGQTLLLSTDSIVSEGLTVSAKPIQTATRGRGRGGGRGGRGGAHNTNFSPNVSTQQQLKSSAKVVSTPSQALKSSTTDVNNMSSIDTSTPGPSQLSASRRTYSKKSNIVWITPDPSQGSTNPSFSTIATTCAVSPTKPSSATKQTTLSTTNSSAVKNTSQTQSTTVSISLPARTTSPSKTIGSTTSSITTSKPIVSTPSSTKMTTSTPIASKSTVSVTSTKANTSITTTSKSTVPTTTASKMVTASKTTVPTTTASKLGVQSITNTGSKAITVSASNKSTPVSKTQPIGKSTIKVSDITATKTIVSTALTKTIASTSVTKPIVSTPSVTKSIASTTTASKTVPSTITLQKSTLSTTTSITKTTASSTPLTKPNVSTLSSNKTVTSTASVTKPIVSTTTVTKSTVSTAVSTSVAKPIVSNASALKTVSTPIIANKTDSKISAPTTSASKVSTSINTSTKSVVSTPTTLKELSSITKPIDSPVKVQVSIPIATKSTASTTSTIESISTSNSSKKVVSKTPITEAIAVTEFSASRLSPTKAISSKIETNVSKQTTTTSAELSTPQMVTKIKLPLPTKNTDLDNSDKSKVQSISKGIKEKEKSKTIALENKPNLVTNTSNETKKSENEIIGVTATEGDSILAHKSSEKTGKKVEKEVEKEAEKEAEKLDDLKKSGRKSRRNSKSSEESKKEKVNTTVTETKTNELKTKDDIIIEKPKEKVNETKVDSSVQKITTRRTSRKLDISSNLDESKTVSSEVIPSVIPTVTPIVPNVETPVQIKSGRVTRASSVKKPEEKPSNVESNDSKTNSTNKSIKGIAAKPESVTPKEKASNDFDKILEVSRTESTPEPIKTVSALSSENITSTRSVKKKVQFEIKENNKEEQIVKTDEKVVKTAQLNTPISTRRSLRSSTPVVENKISVNNETNKKVDQEVNEHLVIGNKTDIENSSKTETEKSSKTQIEKSSKTEIEKNSKTEIEKSSKTEIEKSSKTQIEKSPKTEIETNNKTPQRFSARKRKELPKSEVIETEEPSTKSLRKSSVKSNTSVDESSANFDRIRDSPKTILPEPQSLSFGRVRRERKSKNITRIETKIPNKELIRHSIETSEPTIRTNKKKSFIQSFINENDSQEKEENVRRKTISSLSDLRSPNECYDYSTNECSFYIRHQSVSLTPKQSGGNYLCQKCGFHTSRINNLVVHHRDQCSYVKNANIQHWQSELQKRVKTNDSSDTSNVSKSKPKKRKMENNSEPVSSSSLDKSFDEMDGDSDEEQITAKPEINEKTNQNPTISDIDAMLMGSDDEDLLSIDNIENPKRELGFAEDDIVWVESHNVHWPALVSKVHLKERKASIKFIESPWSQKSLKTNVSLISLFDSAEMNKKYLREGRKSVNGQLLVKAVQKAEEFLRKRCLGSEMSATKFFDQIDSDFSENYADDEERVPNTSTQESSSNKVKGTANVSNDDLAESTSSPVVSNDCDNEEDKSSESNEAVAQWKERRRLQNAKLLQCIKDGKVETHLVGVYRETILSERHQKFKSGSESEKNQLKHVPWFGPIDDEEQQEEIYDYCSQLFKSNFKTDGIFDTVAYIFEVWVPEAIVKAISRVRRIELKEAENIFAKGVILSKSEERRTQNELQKELQKEAEKQQISHSTSD